MTRTRIFSKPFYVLLLWLFSASLAQADNKAEEEGKIKALVEQNVVELLAEYEEEKIHYETDPKRFYKAMEGALSRIVDFKRIAARVMGKYARKASKEERGQFTRVFKDSLFNTYTKTLVESGSFDIKVTKAEINSRSDKRASVDMDVISDSGNVYPVTYSMYKNKQDQWLMENVIVFGVNVGLAFRDKFEAQYREHRGNIAAVIDNWSVDIKLDVPESAQTAQRAEEG